MPPPKQVIRALDQRQCFELLPSGEIRFCHNKVLFRSQGQICYGYVLKRERRESFPLNEIENVRAIPPDSFRPLLPAGTTVLSDPPVLFHVKQPSLMNYVEGSNMSEPIIREIEVCELLLQQPHPNMAKYFGCQVTDGRVEGICFQRYPETLMEKLNPKCLNKSMFVQSRILPRETAERYLLGIEDGIIHLHSLGFVHNDLNPSNVMITEGDTAVIIDFDSCAKIGEPIDASKIKRTHGWYDRSNQVADVNNDYAALQELRVWLQSSDPEEFKFRDT